MTNPSAQPMLLSNMDHQRLASMLRSIQQAPSADEQRCLQRLRDLERRLAGSQVVDPDQVPPDVVTMNTRLQAVDEQSGRQQELTLVFDDDADIFRRRLSVLSPLGIALLGKRQGQMATWKTRGKLRRMRVQRIVYQPEAAGELWM
ncbi:MAG: GreA/GreB family elongation factor [Phycisphaerales bacterium]|nr:GreA/GreB family elongation factor [Phycisphaerales bacterium]